MSYPCLLVETSSNGFEKEHEPESEELLPYVMDYLTPRMVEEARNKLNETEEVRTLALEELRNCIEKESTLYTPTDTAFLLAFLRSRKFNVRKAFRLLQNYWRFRSEFGTIFDESRTDSIKTLILRNFLGFLPYRDKDGSAVLILKIGSWDPSVDSFEDLFRALSAMLLHSIRYPPTQVAGYRLVFDARNLSWPQLKYCTPNNILLLIRSTQYCFPARYKAFHILCENRLFNLAWTIVRPLLTPKLKKRIVLHGSDLSPLLEAVAPSALPIEYGGHGPPFDNEKWANLIDEDADKVLGLLNYGYRD